MEYQDIVNTIALTMGIAWASGINLYAAIFVLGLLGNTGNLDLPPGLVILSDPLVMMAAGFMYCVEFFADKIPGVDTGWDALHTFIRIPAGAVLAAAAVGDVSPVVQLAAGILGGGLTAGAHFTKAGTRVLINTSPEPFSNWAASLLEDVAVITGVWAAVNHPYAMIAFVLLFIVLIIWLLPKLWRGVKHVFRAIASVFKGKKEPPPATTACQEVHPPNKL